jgi:hypothetical protein
MGIGRRSAARVNTRGILVPAIKPLILGILLWLSGLQGSAAAVFDVFLDTSAYAGASVLLVFDWAANDGAINNTAKVSGFGTDGVFDPAAATVFGDVTGTLDALIFLHDTQPFNEFAQPLMLGQALNFTLTFDNQFSGLGLPDELTLFLLDAGTGTPLFPTTNLFGTDALLSIRADGGTNIEVYSPTLEAGSPPQVTRTDTVPEPAMGWLWLIGAPIVRRFLPASPRPG